MTTSFQHIMDLAKSKSPKTIALASAEDISSLEALKKAADLGIAKAILVGEKNVISQRIKELNFSKGIEDIIDIKDKNEVAFQSVKLVTERKANLIMKGIIHTDTLLRAILNKEIGLRTGKLLSHVFTMKVPAYRKLLFVTDAAMNITPDLIEKKEILQNCIDVALAMELKNIKVAVLGAVEEVNPKMPATLDAACLAKMADRGQIKGAMVDGPLAFDNAISSRAAKEKGIKSLVAGDADILLVPQIEAGNILFKTIAYFTDSDIAGIVVGAKVPVILTSRADTDQTKFNSITLAVSIS